ncbi:hypothetical protein PRIPAC_94692 [Pristionchus pacificus]|uniref:Uncharacterized protein n=1 Tax=Pristionchus pacificus TaxID=54126 RepID=A0A2A6BIE7_PRIPA|nr:hypothetical protein PRIPAC_94692 [Pristionchus pacificus]|eukprot:PDM65680.1 hypothetical protein PRIPAC_45594 [Pristionchus pacificus]
MLSKLNVMVSVLIVWERERKGRGWGEEDTIPPHVGHHHHHRPPATTSFSSSLGSELDTTGGGPATPSPATLFAAPLVPPLLHDSSPFSPPTGLGDGDGGTAPSSASSSSSSESPGGGGHQNLPPPSSTSTMQTAARGLGMMGMSGGYADSLKILFSKVGMDDVVWTNGDVDITGRMGE